MSNKCPETILLSPGGCVPEAFKVISVEADCVTGEIVIVQENSKGEQEEVRGLNCKPTITVDNDCAGSQGESWLISELKCPDQNTLQTRRVEAPYSDCLTTNGFRLSRSNLELEGGLPLEHNPDTIPVTELTEVGYSLTYTNPLSCRQVKACFEMFGTGAYVRFDNPKVTDYMVPDAEVARHFGAYYFAISHQFQVNGGGFIQFSYDDRDIILAVDDDKPLLRTSEMLSNPVHIFCQTLDPGETITVDYRALAAWTGPTDASGNYVGNADFEVRVLERDRSFLKLNVNSL